MNVPAGLPTYPPIPQSSHLATADKKQSLSVCNRAADTGLKHDHDSASARLRQKTTRLAPARRPWPCIGRSQEKEGCVPRAGREATPPRERSATSLLILYNSQEVLHNMVTIAAPEPSEGTVRDRTVCSSQGLCLSIRSSASMMHRTVPPQGCRYNVPSYCG